MRNKKAEVATFGGTAACGNRHLSFFGTKVVSLLSLFFLAMLSSLSATGGDGETATLKTPQGTSRYVEFLETHVKVRDAITWNRGDQIIGFKNWDEKTAGLFFEAVASVEAGKETPFPAPPKPLQSCELDLKESESYHCQEETTAMRIYFFHVAHSLKADLEGRFPWRLVEFDEVQLHLLLGSENFIDYIAEKAWCFNSQMNWNPKAITEFLERERIVGKTQKDTVHALTDWFRQNLEHNGFMEKPDGRMESYADTLRRNWGRPWIPEIEMVLNGAPNSSGRHVTNGCVGTSRLFREVLRSANIPVRIGRTLLDGGSHHRVEFPSIDLALAHADDPYSRLIMGTEVPISGIFYSLDEISRFIDHPKDLIDAKEADLPKPLPSEEKASYNLKKKLLDLAVRNNGSYLLNLRAQNPNREEFPSELDRRLTGDSVGGKMVIRGKVFFTEGERKRIIEAIDLKVLQLGHGDWDAGIQAIRKKSLKSGNRFSRDERGVITDSKTGLQWLEGPDKPTSWAEANSWIQGLGNGWRLPNLEELEGIYIKDSPRMGANKDLSSLSFMPLKLDPEFSMNRSYWVYWGISKNVQLLWGLNFSCGEQSSRSVNDNKQIWSVRVFAVRSKG